MDWLPPGAQLISALIMGILFIGFLLLVGILNVLYWVIRKIFLRAEKRGIITIRRVRWRKK